MGSLETATTQPGHTMGTKLSKATNTPPADKSSTLPAPHNDEDESKVAVQSETLPRSGFERTTGLGKSFRKSMRKLVGKKKVKEEEAEKKESATVEETTVETKDDEKDDFKTVQQKARAEFFKEEEDDVNVSLIGSPVVESEQETSPNPTEESREPAERDTATNETLAEQQLVQESSEEEEKSQDDEIKKHDDDVNNGAANETEQSEEEK